MTKILVCLVFFLSSVSLIAQDPVDTAKVTAHELYFNFGSAIAYLAGGNIDERHIGLTYKHVMKDKNAIRVGIQHVTHFSPYFKRYIDRGYYFTDSTVIIQREYVPDVKRIQGSLGFEWIRGGKRLKQFYGADIGFSRYWTDTYMANLVYPKDTCSACQPGPAPLLGLNQTELIEHTINEVNYFELIAFYGIKYSISKHFLLSAQVGAGFGQSFIKSVTVTDQPTSIINKRREFSHARRPLLNEVSLVYRF